MTTRCSWLNSPSLVTCWSMTRTPALPPCSPNSQMSSQMNFPLDFPQNATSTTTSPSNLDIYLPGDPSTDFPHLNLMPCAKNWTASSRMALSNPACPHLAPPSYLSRRKMAPSECVLTTTPSITSPSRTI